MADPPVLITPARPLDGLADQLVADVEAEAKAAGPAAPAAPEPPKLSPVEEWRKALAEAKMTEDDAFEILNAMVSRGFYEASRTILHGRMAVRFRTRDGANNNRVAELLDRVITRDLSVAQAVTLRQNLAASLMQCGETSFTPLPDPADAKARAAALDARLAFVDRLPESLMFRLFTELAKFDHRVYLALSDGADAGF